MLNPNQDRLDYGQILSPPAGYSLDYAVGTTYSLDLDALVGACIALGLSEETDSDLMHNPICLLEALRRVGDKLVLFTEAGQIHMPNAVTPLYVLLEKMVFQVAMKKKSKTAGFFSFHPKFWLIRYESKVKDILYRIVVLSRNLTFDRSWDVTFSMDGYLSREEKTDKNDPVSDFLTYLTGFLPKTEQGAARKKKLIQIGRELSKVHFQLESKEFTDFEFMPVGIRGKAGVNYSMENSPLFRDSFQELLIMSPFLSKGVIRGFNDRYQSRKHPDYMLITRAVSLNKLKARDCNHFKAYTLKDAVVDGETMISEDGAAAARQDIHAKVYMTRKGSQSDLYLGSLNASDHALYGNVEFMICLHGKSRYLNLEALRSQLFCGTDETHNPFQPAVPQEESAEEPSSALADVIRELARMSATAEAAACGDAYCITVHFPAVKTQYSVSVSPLLSGKSSLLGEMMIFRDLSAVQLSEFYKITVSDGTSQVSRVLMIPTLGLPEDREKNIISEIINSKSSFYQYISFLLGDGYALSSMEGEQIQRSAGAGRTVDLLPPLYEKMLRTAAEEPERLKEIGKLIQAVSDDGVIPENFEKLYSVFQKVVNLGG